MLEEVVTAEVVNAPVRLTFPVKVSMPELLLSVKLPDPVVVPVIDKFPVLAMVSVIPVMTTLFAKERFDVPVMDWAALLKVAPPAVKTPALAMPPRNIRFAGVATAVVINEVDAPTLTFPIKVVTPLLLESVKPPLVVRVVVPVTLKLAVLVRVSVIPVMATLLANDTLPLPEMIWLLVLKVAPPPENVPVLAIPPLKTRLGVAEIDVLIKVPVTVASPVKVVVPDPLFPV